MPPMPPPAIRTGRGEDVCEGVGVPDMQRLSMQWRAGLVADAAGACAVRRVAWRCGLRQFSQRLLGTEIDLDPQRKALAVVYLLERF
jgi:hypothetical protein